MRQRSASLFLVALAIVLWGCSFDLQAEQFVDREDKQFVVEGKPEVVLVTFDGSIEIRAWDRSEVAVTIERRAATEQAAKELRVSATQDGNRVRVEVAKPERFINIGMSPSVSLKVSLPRTSDVEARSGDGSIAISDVSGQISLRTGDGSISGTSLRGVLAANTGDGSVALDGVSGRVTAHTGDGSVRIDGSMQAVNARTGDGSIVVRAGAESAAVEDWVITTGDGGMTLELPDGFNAEVEASTGDGRISVEGLPIARTGATTEEDELRGRLGSGGKVLKLRTGDGSIRLRRSS